MKSFIRRLCLLLVSVFGAAVCLRADPPEYTGAAFDQVQILADDGLLFFGVIIAAAIIIVGFFKGRQWFKRL